MANNSIPSSAEMRELFDKVDAVRPLAEKDGEVYVTFEDAATLNSFHSYEPKGTGMKTYNMDGSVASTGKTVHAINPDYFYMNRYRIKGKAGSRELQVVSAHTVDGFRCIKEQSTGRIFIKSIPCYVIIRDENGKLKLDRVITVSDSEFVSDFTNTLDKSAMAEILPLIVNYGVEVTADTMPI